MPSVYEERGMVTTGSEDGHPGDIAMFADGIERYWHEGAGFRGWVEIVDETGCRQEHAVEVEQERPAETLEEMVRRGGIVGVNL